MVCRCVRRKNLFSFLVVSFIVIVFIQILLIGFYTIKLSTFYERDVYDASKLEKTPSQKNEITTQYNSNDKKFQIESLYKLIPCKQLDKFAISAIKRARTRSCQLEIANISCSYFEKRLFSDNLPRYCVQKDVKARGTEVGCYSIESTKVYVPYESKLYETSKGATNKCLFLCLQGGFSYALLGKHICQCGMIVPNEKQRKEVAKCHHDENCKSPKACNTSLRIVLNTGYVPFHKKIKDKNLLELKESIDNKVRIVFLLTLNGRAVRQVKRLLKAIYRPHHYYYIHIDKRQEYLLRSLQNLEIKFSNIKFAQVQFPTMWGGTTLLSMILQSIKDLLTKVEWKWDFITNMSECDFPIKPIEVLEKYLSQKMDNNFVKSHGYNTFSFIKKQGLDKSFHQCDDHMWKIGDRSLPNGIVIDGGSDWIGLNRKFCEYITYGHDNLLNGLKALFKYTLLPAETFFHTILLNSKFCDTVVDNNLRVTNWKRTRGCKCQYKHIVDWCGCSPNDFVESDFPKLEKLNIKAYFFARKFESIISNEILNKVESSIGFTKYSDHPSYHSFWLNEYHHLDSYPQTDDYMLSVYHALANYSMKYLKFSTKNQIQEQSCHLAPYFINEVFTHKKDDIYLGMIIQFKTKVNNLKVTILESLIHPQFHSNVFDLEGDFKRLKSIKVGTNYDPKENIFRNMAHLMGPTSKIGVELVWEKEKSEFTISMVWIDPTGYVAISYDSKIGHETQILHHMPKLNHPLRAGEWTLKIIHDNKLVAKSTFIIFPVLITNNGTIYDPELSKLVNGGPNNYSNYDFKYMDDLWGSEDKEILKLKAAENSWKVGSDLEKWMTNLLAKQFTVMDLCYLNSDNKNFACPNIEISPCYKTSWSSFFPDPKSEIEIVDSETGFIL